MTTTGLVTDDFEAWSPLPQLILLVMMFIGGCTGSTSGGLKVSRFLLLAKVVDREFRRMVEPRAGERCNSCSCRAAGSNACGVFAVRLGGEVIPERTSRLSAPVCVSRPRCSSLALFVYSFAAVRRLAV